MSKLRMLMAYIGCRLIDTASAVVERHRLKETNFSTLVIHCVACVFSRTVHCIIMNNVQMAKDLVARIRNDRWIDQDGGDWNASDLQNAVRL